MYCTSAPAPVFIDNIRQLAGQADVRFHLLVSQQDGRLTLDRLVEMVPEWLAADVWFCGPAGLGNSLRNGMVTRGFPAGHFHQQLFGM